VEGRFHDVIEFPVLVNEANAERQVASFVEIKALDRCLKTAQELVKNFTVTMIYARRYERKCQLQL
jgi:hypothetical protein